jgi:hypothetical protein
MKDFNKMIKEVNNREKDEYGCIKISVQEFLEMKKQEYERPDDITMYIVKLEN